MYFLGIGEEQFQDLFDKVWGVLLDFFPCAMCLLFATVWNQNLSFCMVFATFWHVYLPFCAVFAIFLALQPLILSGICYMLVVHTFMWVSLGIFRVSFCLFLQGSFRVSLGFHLGCHLVCIKGIFRFSLRFHLGLAFLQGFIQGFYLQGFIQGFFRVSAERQRSRKIKKRRCRKAQKQRSRDSRKAGIKKTSLKINSPPLGI